MRQYKLALSLLTAAILTACGGGGGGGDQTLKVKFSSQVSFGDSLSDVGTYAVGGVAALKGGKFTVNGAIDSVQTGKNWTELMAAQLGLPAPCPAQTGLDGNAALGFSVPVVNKAECTSYAQGGARVTNPVGPGHKLTGSALGQLTVPVATQIANHLAKVGSFKGDEVVFVMAGGNDALMNLNQLSTEATTVGGAAGAKAGQESFAKNLTAALAAKATNPQTAAVAIGTAIATAAAAPGATSQSIVTAAVGAAAVQPGAASVADPAVYGPIVAAAQATATKDGEAAGAKAGADYVTANAPVTVAKMATAGAELAALVKTQIVGKGAKYVVVVNLPDLATTPAITSKKDAAIQGLVDQMVRAFNGQLTTGLSGEARVLISDAYSVSHDEYVNPGIYGLTNVNETACDLSAAKNPFGSSLICNAANLRAGDVSHYQFADEVHPTPYGYWLLARYVLKDMAIKGWI